MDLMTTRGDTPTFRLLLTDQDGEPVDLTGASIRCTARRQVAVVEPDDDIQWEHTVSDGIVVEAPATGGVALLTLEAADTSDLERVTILRYDCQVVKSGVVATVLKGRMLVEMDVSTVAP